MWSSSSTRTAARSASNPIASSDAELIELVREVGRRYGLSEREFNPSHPELNLQLPDGSRLFATAWVCGRPVLAIRRHRYMKIDLDDLVGLGTIDRGHGQLPPGRRFARASRS